MSRKKPTRPRTSLPRHATIDRDGAGVIAFTFRIKTDQLKALRAVQTEAGIPITQQLRRAIDLWLASIGRAGSGLETEKSSGPVPLPLLPRIVDQEDDLNG